MTITSRERVYDMGNRRYYYDVLCVTPLWIDICIEYMHLAPLSPNVPLI